MAANSFLYDLPDPFEETDEPNPGPDVLAEARGVLWTPTAAASR